MLNIKIQTRLLFMGTGGAGEKEVRGWSGVFCRHVKVIVYLPPIYLSLILMRCLQV